MSTGTAPTGGHADRSALGSDDPVRSMPSACNDQPEPVSAREKIDTARVPESSGPQPTTWIATDPPAGNTRGAARFSSSTTPQPTSSPPRIANSTNPAPGNSTTPPTAWSFNQVCTLGDNRPVSTTPPEAGSSTTAPSNGCSLAVSPRPVAS